MTEISECVHCGRECAPIKGKCPNCGKIWLVPASPKETKYLNTEYRGTNRKPSFRKLDWRYLFI